MLFGDQPMAAGVWAEMNQKVSNFLAKIRGRDERRMRCDRCTQQGARDPVVRFPLSANESKATSSFAKTRGRKEIRTRCDRCAQQDPAVRFLIENDAALHPYAVKTEQDRLESSLACRKVTVHDLIFSEVVECHLYSAERNVYAGVQPKRR